MVRLKKRHTPGAADVKNAGSETEDYETPGIHEILMDGSFMTLEWNLCAEETSAN